jgi:uncharacterized protein (TIGR03083 family)
MGMTSDATLPPDRPTVDDLAAFALDATEGDEQIAIGRHLEADADAAAVEQTLRSAAGELGAAGAIAVETPPPPALRARVLTAAVARRAPAAAGSFTPVEMHRSELARALYTLRRLAAHHWTLPLDPPELAGWTVHDAVIHLAANEALLAQVLGAGLPWVPERDTANETRTSQAHARLRDRPPVDALDELEAAAAVVDAHVSALSTEELNRTVEFWGRPTSIVGTLYTRAFETWTHGDDIRRAIGVPEVPPPAPTMHLLCRAAVSLVPRLLRARGIEAPPRLVRFHLTGFGAETWDVTLPDGLARAAGDEPPDTEISVAAVALCRGVAARIPDDGLPYTSTGDTALAAQIIDSVPALAVI